jgi:hypothetical protein
MHDHVIRPRGLVRERAVGTPSLLLSTSFLAQWINIAMKQETVARAARERAYNAGDDAQARIEALEEEMQASMVAISGSAHAIDALYGTTRELIDLPEGTVERWHANRTSRPGQILETLKYACKLGRYASKWGTEFRWLFDLRDAAVHHESPFREPVPHPANPGWGNFSKEMSEYELGGATRATDLAVRVAVIAHENPRPEQERFAKWTTDRAHWAARLRTRRPIF